MNIDYISDIHANHHVFFKEEQREWERSTREFANRLIDTDSVKDVLVVAGDISDWSKQVFWILDEFTKTYNIVFVVLGNHDYYLISNEDIEKYNSCSFRKIEMLKDMLSKNKKIQLLDKSVVEYNGKVFAGDTMWYYPNDIHDQYFYNFHMSDRQYILVNNDSPSKRLTLELLKQMNKEALDWYMTLEDKEIDVFVSHSPPVNNPKSPYSYNECFVTPVPFLVSKHWITGHQHTRYNFELGDTNFYMNPLGYPREHEFIKVKSFKIKK